MKQMKIFLPYKLKQMFLNLEGKIDATSFMVEVTEMGSANKEYVRADTFYKFTIDIENDKNLRQACLDWFTMLTPIDIGPFIGLFPLEIDDNKVTFHSKKYDSNRKNWKDWFILEDSYMEISNEI
jgi:hypothetical protein